MKAKPSLQNTEPDMQTMTQRILWHMICSNSPAGRVEGKTAPVCSSLAIRRRSSKPRLHRHSSQHNAHRSRVESEVHTIPGTRVSAVKREYEDQCSRLEESTGHTSPSGHSLHPCLQEPCSKRYTNWLMSNKNLVERCQRKKTDLPTDRQTDTLCQ